ncbi:Cauli-VI domain-containing protein [Pyrenophora tritici-repentis]|nr:Cauli-VI domain-containing protein [Pyrenophora tritici-repentis]
MISEYREVFKDATEDTTPKRGSTAYYAVAHGATPGIKLRWYGVNGVFEATHEISSACHKCFRTEAQAKAFIEDWKESYAEVVRQAVRKGLDEGLRPRDMSLNVEGLLQEGNQVELLAEQLGTQLGLDGS